MTCVNRLESRCLVRPGDVPALTEGFEVVGAFNPAVAEVGGRVAVLLRVAEAPVEKRAGYVALPRMEGGACVIDWVGVDEVDTGDPRVAVFRNDGRVRLTFVSHLRVAWSADGLRVDTIERAAAIAPVGEFEAYGVEDPRATYIDGRWWVTYVGVSRHGMATALASTDDFVRFERHGLIFPIENKDVVLFPEKVGGRYAALHRPSGSAKFGKRSIWHAGSPDLLHWGDHGVVLRAEDMGTGDAGAAFERIGAGPPPVRIDEGWLVIYHAMAPTGGEGVGAYHAYGMILAGDDPSRVLWRGSGPLMSPVEGFERGGFFSDVVFPTGTVVRGDEMDLFYGAADTCTGVVRVSLREVVDRIKGV